jgi:predicted RNA binding protein YcfA (HicA-like mRNA interferase family)
MAKGFYETVVKLLSEAGFVYSGNAKGSHEKWLNQKSGLLLIVPRNLKSRHTANGILKDAGIGKVF